MVIVHALPEPEGHATVKVAGTTHVATQPT